MNYREVLLAEGPGADALRAVLAQGAGTLVRHCNRQGLFQKPGRPVHNADCGPGDEVRRCAFHSRTFLVTNNPRLGYVMIEVGNE